MCSSRHVLRCRGLLFSHQNRMTSTISAPELKWIRQVTPPSGIVVGLCRTALCVAATLLHVYPWLFEDGTWIGCLGIGLTLHLAASSSFFALWLCVMGAIAIAFCWSPAAMAHAMSTNDWVGLIVVIPLVAWDAFRAALGYWLAARITRDARWMWFAAASVAITLEYVVPSTFPWRIGNAMLSTPSWIQATDIFGPSYPTFVAFLCGGTLHVCLDWLKNLHVARKSATQPGHPQQLISLRRLACLPAVWLLAINYAYGLYSERVIRQALSTAPKVRIGLVQFDPTFKNGIIEARRLTASVCDSVDFVCWPESTAGTLERDLDCLSDERKLFEKSREPGRGIRPWPNPSTELLFAGKTYIRNNALDTVKVTAMLVDRDETIVDRYDKRFLMPFGEYVPGENLIPALSQFFDLEDRIDRGTRISPAKSASGARIGVMLCFEDMVPQAAREMTGGGANVLIALINASQFDSPITLYQHRLLAQTRAIECRRYLLRCAATGETCVINPLGEIESRLPIQTNDAMVADVSLLTSRSIYSRVPIVMPLCLLAFFTAVGLNTLFRRGQRN